MSNALRIMWEILMIVEVDKDNDGYCMYPNRE